MVAYSFRTAFVAEIMAGTKRRTIRLPRKRHARPGELIQIYQGMRTRQCRRIIPDPVCVGVDDVRINLLRSTITVNGIPLKGEARDLYARADGFIGGIEVPPFQHMMRWFARIHGHRLFVGVAIRWERLS